MKKGAKVSIFLLVVFSLISLVAVLMSVGFGGATTPLSSCGTLSTPGETYVLANNILNVAGTCFTITANDIVLDGAGFTISGDRAGNDYGIDATGRVGLTIKNLKITDFATGIILRSGSSNNIIKDNTVESNTDIGIYLVVDASNNVLTNNTVNSNLYAGIMLNANANNNQITNNVVNLNLRGIHIASSSNNNILTNNAVNSNSNCGISLQSSSSNQLTNNKAISNFDGICAGSSYSNVLIGNNASSNSGGGIVIGLGSSNVLTSNIVNANSFAGIHLQGSTNNQLTSNVVNSNGFGIFLNLNSNNNTLRNNIANLNSLRGINIDTSSGNTIKNNAASLNLVHGIVLQSWSSNNMVKDNTVESNTDTGIYLVVDASNNVLTNNTVNSNLNGIYIRINSNNNLVYNNNLINNQIQAIVENSNSVGNVFNLALPTGGNYWSSYDTSAEGCNDVDIDGICDAPYIFFGGQDNLPWTVQNGWPTSVEADADIDGIADSSDNCPAIFNPSQSNLDSDNLGDVCDSDKDGDGIANEIDRNKVSLVDESMLVSNDFTDVSLGGVSYGTITNRAGWNVSIIDLPFFSGTNYGVRVGIVGSGTTALITSCSNNVETQLDVSTETVDLTCGSTTVLAVQAKPWIYLREPGSEAKGKAGLTKLSTGDGATLGSFISASSDNVELISTYVVDENDNILITGEINPGRTIDIVPEGPAGEVIITNPSGEPTSAVFSISDGTQLEVPSGGSVSMEIVQDPITSEIVSIEYVNEGATSIVIATETTTVTLTTDASLEVTVVDNATSFANTGSTPIMVVTDGTPATITPGSTLTDV